MPSALEIVFSPRAGAGCVALMIAWERARCMPDNRQECRMPLAHIAQQ